MIDVRRAVDRDAAALARLHAESLPSSMLSMLGIGALERFYRFALANETVWAAADGETVVGGCVLSEAPHSVLSRFARHAPFALSRDLATAVVSNGHLRRRLAGRFRDAKRAASDGAHAPEVTQIFTDGRRRGEGIGAKLLRTCEETLRNRGVRKYFVHTERDDNEAGIRFYRREGFAPVTESHSFGQAFLVMQKDLA